MKSAQEVSQSIRAQLKILDPDLSVEPITVERKIIDTAAQEIAEGYGAQIALAYQFDIDTKAGDDLDRFAALFGFYRQGGRRATGTVTFSRATPATTDILIEGGTEVLKPASSVTPAITFFTTTTAAIFAGTTEVEVPIEAVNPGEQGNVPAGGITLIGQGASEVSEVINQNATSGGRAPETDSEFRVRFRNTIFRNIAGTPDQFMALAIASRHAAKANVIGPQSRFIEYMQVEDEALPVMSSQIPYSKYTYDFDYFLTDGALLDEEFFAPNGIDYTFNDAVPPTITVNNIAKLSPGTVVLLEHTYCSVNSRNDPTVGIANNIDVYVSGQDAISAGETVVFPMGGSAQIFSVANLPVATLNVTTTEGFMDSGTLDLNGQILTYTGKTNVMTILGGDHVFPEDPILVEDTSEFAASGHIAIGGQRIQYGSKTQVSITTVGDHEFPIGTVNLSNVANLESSGAVFIDGEILTYTSKTDVNTTTSGSHTLPEATITVVSTAGFANSGRIVVGGQIVDYTGTTATTFTGCTGGTGAIGNGSAVTQDSISGVQGGTGLKAHGSTTLQGKFATITGGTDVIRSGAVVQQGSFTGVSGGSGSQAAGSSLYQGNIFVDTSDSRYKRSNWARAETGEMPSIGSRVQELLWQPVISLPSGIIIDGIEYVKGVHYWLVKDITNYKGSKRGRDAIEWDATVASAILEAHQIKMHSDPEDLFHVAYTLEYIFDKSPITLNELMDAHKQTTSDVLVHAAVRRYLNVNLIIMYTPGYSREAVDEQITQALITFCEKLHFGAVIQISDLLDQAHDIPGVDNVRLATPSDGVAYGVQEVAADGETLIGPPHLNDFSMADSDLCVINAVITTRKSQNTWQTFF